MGRQNSTGAENVDAAFDDAVAVTPSDTFDSTTRLRGVRGLWLDGGGNVTVVTSAMAAAAEIDGTPKDFGAVTDVVIDTAGNYSVLPTGVTFTGGGGTGAAGTVQGSGTGVTGVTITNHGKGYTSKPTIAFTGGTGTAATAHADVDAPAVSFVVPAGEILPLRVAYVLAQGTDATGIKAFK